MLKPCKCTMCHRDFDGASAGAFCEIHTEVGGTVAHCCTVPCLQRWLALYQVHHPLPPSLPPVG